MAGDEDEREGHGWLVRSAVYASMGGRVVGHGELVL